MPHKNQSRNKKLKAPRAFFHDYTKPGYYLITLTAYPGSPPLSVIKNHGEDTLRKGDMIIPKNTPLGENVRKELAPILRRLRRIPPNE